MSNITGISKQHTHFNFIFVFSDVCVDKARSDEYEQRASELAQKASIYKENHLDVEPTTYLLHHLAKTKPN